MIQFLTVTKKYSGDIRAVEEISFEISDGEFVFLVGPSGSGKTTLIKMLIREELPSSGKIFFGDEDITRFNRNKVYTHRRRIGVIFQDFKLIPDLNAYENIAFVMEVAGRSDKEIKEHVPYLLDIVGLSHRMKSFPRQLSGGEKQRVAIARAMANNPKLLIADEPTGNLDPESAWDIIQILSKINNWGTTVLMSTHGSDIVNTLNKRVLKMQDGYLVRDDIRGTYEEIDDFSLKVMKSTSEKLILNNQTETSSKESPAIEVDKSSEIGNNLDNQNEEYESPVSIDELIDTEIIVDSNITENNSKDINIEEDAKTITNIVNEEVSEHSLVQKSVKPKLKFSVAKGKSKLSKPNVDNSESPTVEKTTDTSEPKEKIDMEKALESIVEEIDQINNSEKAIKEKSTKKKKKKKKK
jgi:cell division transport system ATP-binding protein